MGVAYEQMRTISADLYATAVKKVPDNTLDASRRASSIETHELARRTLEIMTLHNDAAARMPAIMAALQAEREGATP